MSRESGNREHDGAQLTIPGIEAQSLNPKWSMRVRSWLDIRTVKPVYSVEVRHPEFKIWLAIYDKKRGLKRFKNRESAERFIAEVKREAPKEPQ